MRHNQNSFFNELTPLANKIRAVVAATPPRLSVAKDVNECQAKRAAKLARRAARAGHAGELK